MFRLFRKIRKKLINDANFGKYMLYATGEVIILIFGILIALQVNNWNEKRQDRITEISILKSMKIELETDFRDLSQNISTHKIGIRAAQIIIDHLENNLAYNDSLAKHFMDISIYTMFVYQEGSYVNLQSLGVGLISNKKLRNQIIELYALYEVIIRYEKSNINRSSYAENEIFNSRFDQLYYWESKRSLETSNGKMVPLDYEGLKNDDEYKYYIKTYRNANEEYLQFYFFPVKAKVVDLISSIEEEVGLLEN